MDAVALSRLFYWHHIVGLVFGVLTLTWAFSGCHDEPMGLSGRTRPRRGLARARSLAQVGDIKASLETLRHAARGANVVSRTSAPFGGKLYWMATFGDQSHETA
jgi:hypothetical protein